MFIIENNIQKPAGYANSENGVGAFAATNAVLFMYHPHGKPSTTLAWAEAGDQIIAGGSTNKEDIYWIYYAPRTSSAGADKGRELDGYVMGAWVNSLLDHAFDGSINAAGALVDGGDDPIADLTIVYNPN